MNKQENKKCPECGSEMEEVEDCYEWHGGGCSTDCNPDVHCLDCDDAIHWFCHKCDYYE